MQTAQVYQFDAFSEQEVRVPLRVAHGSEKRRRRMMSRKSKQVIKIVCLSILFVSLVCSVLYAQSTVTVLNAQILEQQEEMTQAKSEYAYLTNELEMKTNLKTVEEEATARLGLVKLEPSQIVYVDREKQSTIVYRENWLAQMLHSAGQSSMSFFKEYRRD